MSATIAARARSSASLSAPVRRAAPRRHKTPLLAQILRSAARRPGRALVLIVFGAVAFAILANALLLQKARHPAPMAAAPAPMRAAPARPLDNRVEPPAAVAPAPTPVTPATLPPARPSDLSQAARESASPRPPAAVTSIQRSAPAPVAAARPAPVRDPIADLINGADIRPPGEIRGVAAARSTRRSAEN